MDPAFSASSIGRGTLVRGSVRGEGDLEILGRVEGSVAVSGALTGDVASRGAVTVRATAQVQGNLGGAEVSLEEGASFHGRIEAEFDMPAELQAPAAGQGARAETRSGRGR